MSDNKNLVVKSLIEGLVRKSPTVKICIADSAAEDSSIQEYEARITDYQIQDNGVVTIHFDDDSIIFQKRKISGTYQVKHKTWIQAEDWTGRYFTLESVA